MSGEPYSTEESESASDADPDQVNVEFLRSLLADPGLQSKDRPAVLLELANALANIADEEGDPQHCHEAVELGENALQLISGGICPRQMVLSDLSSIYLTRFELLGSQDDLQRSRHLIEVATQETPIEHESRCLRYVNLGNTLCTVFEVLGRDQDLRDAIAACQVATSARCRDPNVRAKALSNQGRALQMRYDRYQILDDLEEAISGSQEAINLATDPSIRATCRSNLVGHLINLAERDMADETVDRALREGKDNLDNLDGPIKAMLAHNLSYLSRLKYETVDILGGEAIIGDPQDLQAALDYGLLATMDDQGSLDSRAMHLDQFSLCLLHAHKFNSKTKDHIEESSESSDYLALAIDKARKAIALLAGDHPSAASYTNHLVDLLLERRSEDDVREALSLSRSVFARQNVQLLVRLAAGQQLGTILDKLDQLDAASQAFEQAVDLIQDLSRGSLQRSDQQYVLSQITGLSQMASSAALAAGRDAATAFSILERGRSVLVKFAINSRSGHSPALEKDHEARPLLLRWQELKAMLDSHRTGAQASSAMNNMSSVAATSIRLQALEELRELEANIATISKRLGVISENSNAEDLCRVLDNDYAIAFCTTAKRCDAFIASSKGVQNLPLPSLDARRLSRYANTLMGPERITKIRSSTYRLSNAQLRELLSWLWTVAVRPVLDHLGLLSSSDVVSARLPRVCWISSGLMGLMPLHAAGSHDPTSTEFAMRYIISSYAVSSLALSWCRASIGSHHWAQTSGPLKAAAITMPTTPGLPDLDSIDEEVNALRGAIPHAAEVVKPSATEVQSLIPTLNVAHFAGHAEPNASDPSAGCVLLYDKEHDAVDKLSIYAIAEVDTSAAWLAYLSACQTADLQDMNLLDEIIHIAGTFQIAGFHQVVGTLWQAEDEYATLVAQAFYSNDRLRATFEKQQDVHRDTAVITLHEAVLKARAEDPELVLSWAQFVIFGA